MLPATHQNREPFALYSLEPWADPAKLEVFAHITGIKGSNDAVEAKREAALTRIRDLQGSPTIYTDGSASEGNLEGGAAAVITDGDPGDPHVLYTIKKRGKAHTCSYEEEVSAMSLAVEWIAEHCGASDKVVVCTDSQSLCTALGGASPEIDGLRLRLTTCSANMIVQWIPGHTDIPGNELADQAAKDACTLDEPPGAISFGCTRALIKANIKDAPTTHERTKAVYSEYKRKTDGAVTSRADQVLLARIRSGHHMAFGDYRNRIDGDIDPSCPRCDEPHHNLEHWWLECPGVMADKSEIFGEMEMGLEVLGTHPRESTTLARRTLLGVR